MNWLTQYTTLIVIGMIPAALGLLWVWRRDRRTLLSRPMADRMLRLIAGLLILAPFGRAARADTPTEEESPQDDRRGRGGFGLRAAQQTETTQAEQPVITEAMIERNRWQEMRGIYDPLTTNQGYLQNPATVRALSDEERLALFEDLAGRRMPMADLILKVLQADYARQEPDVRLAEFAAALEQREAADAFDHWWNAWLWRMTQYLDGEESSQELIALYASLERHASITDAMIRARFEVKPSRLSGRAWMSKGGPSRDVILAEQETRANLLEAARKAFAEETPTTWRRDAVIRLKLAERSAPAVLWRRGQAIELTPGQTFSFGRLDVLQATDAGPVLVRDLQFGRMKLAEKQYATVWTLPDLLNAKGATTLQTLVQAALHQDDEDAARQLELALPLAHQAIRNALQEHPEAAGAPRLRMILTLFDDVAPVSSELPQPEN